MDFLSATDGPGTQMPKFEFYVREFADSTYGMTADDYSRLLLRTGFEQLVDDAVGSERFHVFGRKVGGIVVTFDTFHRQRNCASAHFRVAGPLYFLPRESLVEEIFTIDRKTLHVRIDARQSLLDSLALFEEMSGFIDFWGNEQAPSDFCSFALEQDAAVALREGVSPRDISARLREVSSRRADMLPKEWQERLDIAGTRTSEAARLISETS
jgi:hypothetical protein